MLRDLLSSRWFQAGLAFFVLCVGGSLLYHWHVQRNTETELERSNRFLRGTEQQNETRPAEKVNVPTENESPGLVNTPEENSDTPMPDETEALPNETETLDLADAFLPDNVGTEETPAEEVPVSPFGFGPYPEVPTDFPFNTQWEEMSKLDELTTRVMVKAWTQGDRFVGATADRDTQKIWLNYPKTVYVSSSQKSMFDGSVTVETGHIRSAGDVEIPTRGEDFPADVRVLDSDSSAIDPYTYLGLPQ